MEGTITTKGTKAAPATDIANVGKAPGPKSDTVEIELFDCILRHGGEMMLQIPVKKASAKELQMLRAIHGEDSVADIAPAGVDIVDMREHVFKLVRKYPHAYGPVASRQRAEKLMNTSLHGYEEWLSKTIDTEDSENIKKQADRNRLYNENNRREQAAALTDAIRAANVPA